MGEAKPIINEVVLLVCLSENVVKPQNAMINHKFVRLKWPHRNLGPFPKKKRTERMIHLYLYSIDTTLGGLDPSPSG